MKVYSKFDISENVFSDLHTLFCGMQQCEPLHSYGPAVREHYLFHYCLDGRGCFYVGSYKYTIEKGQGFLIMPNELTFYQADKDEPWTYLWIAIGGNKVAEFVEALGIENGSPVFSCDNVEKLKNIIEDMLEHSVLSYKNELYVQAKMLEFFSYIVHKDAQPYKKLEKIDNIYVNKAVDYICRNYQNEVTISEIAKYLSLNRSYLTELFSKNLNQTPQQYLMKYRITKSMEMLENTELEIQTIACSCGYANGLSYSKAFKNITGESPTDYRKRKKSKINNS